MGAITLRIRNGVRYLFPSGDVAQRDEVQERLVLVLVCGRPGEDDDGVRVT